MKVVFTFLFSLFILFVYSQSKNNIGPNDLYKYVLDYSADSVASPGCNFPFSSIKIIDVRQDTSKIGFVPTKSYRNKNGVFYRKKLILKGGLKASLESYYNNYYKNCFSADSTLLVIVIKKFWADMLPDYISQVKPAGLARTSIYDCYIKFEYFLKRQDLYLPIKSKDTVLQLEKSILQNISFNPETLHKLMLDYALGEMISTVSYKDYAAKFDVSKRKISLQQFDDHINQRIKYPVLNDSILKRGVYLNYKEFLNNSPSIKEFKFEQNKNKNSVYNIEGGKQVELVSFWGYCDGNDIFYKNSEFKIFRTGNTFEFFNQYMKTATASAINFGPYNSNNNQSFNYNATIVEPVQLDIETGKIY